MTDQRSDLSRLLGLIVESISIPEWLYRKAADRHLSLAEWLHREESALAKFDPDVRPQGSFRFGTVNRPLNADDVYDLDNVCVLKKLSKADLSQQQLKELYGAEVKGYAKAHNMLAPVIEKNRCWRLEYADDVNFHLDTLPCVPEDDGIVQRIAGLGVPLELARRAVAITDKRDKYYRVITLLWPSSNPRGFAAWFEQRALLGRTRAIVEGYAKASVEEVPPYGWKTTLQQSIQLLKRRRDVMFRESPELAPISMIITNLAAHAYGGETDLATALKNIIEKMPSFVRDQRPRVPNPADPAEDYADKWKDDPKLEESFWQWHSSVKRDVADLAATIGSSGLQRKVERLFAATLTEDDAKKFEPKVTPSPAIVKAAPVISIPSAPRPWGRR